MADLVVRAEARADLADIYAYGVSKHGSDVAGHYLKGMREALDRLTSFPQIGPVYPGIRPPIRYLAYRQHHIFYDFDGSTITIVRILHFALDAGRRL